MENRKIFLDFQQKWTLDRVQNMTLDEYTSVGGSSRDDFCYWLESKLDKIGSIWGGSAFKFGIYRCNKPEKDRIEGKRKYESGYAWFIKYGDTKAQAFETIKSKIIEIIKASKVNDLEQIDSIDFSPAIKWKIAFHYQNIDDFKIIDIFQKEMLENIAEYEFGDRLLTIPQIHQSILGNQHWGLEALQNKARELWTKYATSEEQLAEYAKRQKHQHKIDIPLNQILYGPPGTGKTYNTIDKALEILYAYELIDFIPQERGDKKVLFDKFIKQGQISFVTFHQSYGYEDFVEGIKPRLSGKNDESQISEKMEYEIRDGIFKQMCKEASKNYEKSLKNISEVKQEIELDDLLEQYATYIEDELKEGKEPKFEPKEWTTKMKIQGVHRLQNGDFSSIVIGVSNDSSSMQRLSQKVIKRDYEKFKSGEIKDWNDIKPSYESKSHRHGNAGYYFTLYESIAEFEKTHYQTSTIPSLESTLDNRLKPYILIIDEINRGNISKILGELITLLESSKRKDKEEALEVILPYSQEPFSVPNNLYIIGTMNTADRSIALLDTALRRRFEFIEMMPDSSLLSTDCDGVDLQRLLESINNRIEFLLDRERSVGHAFLIDVKNLSDLKAVFKNKILPLLQEYFYDDYAKINAVLNNNGILESTTISHMKSLDEFIDGEKKVWRITDSSKWDIETFKAMYKNTESN